MPVYMEITVRTDDGRTVTITETQSDLLPTQHQADVLADAYATARAALSAHEPVNQVDEQPRRSP
ncbi:hypothetical protein GCM10012275_53020 [Longimycelium tulufanense]|uniref:Uncharacterized protein n=1 Tax=Longimycelium tulufanense TaxID=907463 RepID=A0A8J3CJ06_9PSEU|nr:hypothetical protein [Longimycelium tulufanense]GGM75719.1 hypothetical protein GCM10012275_53020 [Longimycelium tulufanense]